MASEMLADIVAEMRIFKCRDLETGELKLCKAIANYFADRIEAAWKREKAQIEADALNVGDFEHHKDTMRMVVTLIREEGDDPARYEFRIDEAGPTPWNADEIIAGETVMKEIK